MSGNPYSQSNSENAKSDEATRINMKSQSETRDTTINLEMDKVNEINTKCIDLINDEKIDAALRKLKEAESKLERIILDLDHNLDKKVLMVILHNISCCYQKMKDFENCINYLEAVIYHLETLLQTKYQFSFKIGALNLDPIQTLISDNNNLCFYGEIILQLRYFAKFHLQMCAVMSQANNHKDALSHCELAAILCEDNMLKTRILFKKHRDNLGRIKKDQISDRELQLMLNLEKVVRHICKKIKRFRDSLANTEKFNADASQSQASSLTDLESNSINVQEQKDEIDKCVQSLLSENPEDDWVKFLNIGNIMYLCPIPMDELDLESEPGCELLRDAVIEKIIMLSVAYFCVATEYRFMAELNDQTKDQAAANSEMYHSKAIEISFSYLPASSSIIRHYINTYNKTHYSNLSVIVSYNLMQYSN